MQTNNAGSLPVANIVNDVVQALQVAWKALFSPPLMLVCPHLVNHSSRKQRLAVLVSSSK
jgi:hypothetical protein